MEDHRPQSHADLQALFADRIAAPISERDGLTILDIENYVPFLLNAVSSGWQRVSAPRYRATFGLGITDWRVIAMLAIEPEITANRVCEVVKLDKAAVSRSINSMEASEHVIGTPVSAGSRNRTWRLTAKGERVHNQILEIALANELRLVSGIPLADLEICMRSLRQMIRNLDSLSG
ncbi:MarR family transcriptional regulator [Rhodobacterales bacterium HKCCE2091]|nr:MarR family transcriptional regulator [Rhodobacterales bacterium HKCCE2091]